MIAQTVEVEERQFSPLDEDDGYCHLRWTNCPSVLSCCGKSFKPYAHAKTYIDGMKNCPTCQRELCPACRACRSDLATCRACGKPVVSHSSRRK